MGRTCKETPDGCIVKCVREEAPAGKRPLRRPSLRWSIAKDLKTVIIDKPLDAMEDRQQWRIIRLGKVSKNLPRVVIHRDKNSQSDKRFKVSAAKKVSKPGNKKSLRKKKNPQEQKET